MIISEPGLVCPVQETASKIIAEFINAKGVLNITINYSAFLNDLQPGYN
ncbi:hypothetical protein [Pollutibacter soli]